VTTREPQVGDYLLVEAWSSPGPDGRVTGAIRRVVRRTPTTAVLDKGDPIRARRSGYGSDDPWRACRYIDAAEGERWLAVRDAYVAADAAWRAAKPNNVSLVRAYHGDDTYIEVTIDKRGRVDTPEEADEMAARYAACAAWLRARPAKPVDALRILPAKERP
jgi:hypothetical protein